MLWRLFLFAVGMWSLVHVRPLFLLLRDAPLPVCEIAVLSVSVAAEVMPARWPAVIYRAFLRHCCACCLLSPTAWRRFIWTELRPARVARRSATARADARRLTLPPSLFRRCLCRCPKSAVGVELTLSNVAFLVPAALESVECAAAVPPCSGDGSPFRWRLRP